MRKAIALLLAVLITIMSVPIFSIAEHNDGQFEERDLPAEEQPTVDEDIEDAQNAKEFFTLQENKSQNNSRFFLDSYYSDILGKEMTFRVYLPEDYYESKLRYPTVYLLHDNNSSSEQFEADRIDEKLNAWISEGIMQKMIVIMPDTDKDSWFAGEYKDAIIQELIPIVDGEYRTIADPQYRGITGIGMGGHGAYMIGLKHPEVFTSIASHMGDLGTANNQGEKPINKLMELGRNGLRNYSLYLDGGTEDPLTSAVDSTNDIHIYLRNQSVSHQYTVRPGGHDSEFYLASMHKSFKMHSDRFTNGLVSGSITVTPQALEIDETTINVDYSIEVGSSISKYLDPGDGKEAIPMLVTLEVLSGEGGQKLLVNTTVIDDVSGSAQTYKGRFIVPRASLSGGDTFNVKITATLLEKIFEIDTKPIIKVAPIGTEPEDLQIDLMGNWYFIKEPSGNRIDGAAIDLDVSSWRIVQPGLDWWANGFGGYADMGSYVGRAWYRREFFVPADFPTDDLTLLAGKIDDADEVFINGQKVGSTGMKDGEFVVSYWAELREYKIPASVLKYGETNVIAINMINSSGGGGIYSGPMGIYTKAALQKVKGLPSTLAPEDVRDSIIAFVNNQNKNIVEKDINRYRDTISNKFFHSGYNKDRLIDEVSSMISSYETLRIEDSNAAVFVVGDKYLYDADRVITGIAEDGTETEISNGHVTKYYYFEKGAIKEIGDQSRFYLDHYYSELFGRDMTFRVYLPEGYFESNKRYPTVYLLHQFQSDSSSYALDKVDQILDQAIAEGSVKEMIVIMPDSSGMSWWVNQPGSPWQDMVTDELVPAVDSRYRTIPDARYRGIAGVSMGGFGAYVIGIQHPNIFTSIASFMGALSYTQQGQNPINLVKSLSPEALNRFAHYIVCGNLDGYRFDVPAIQLDHYLREVNVPHYFEIGDGAHDSAFYTRYVAQSFEYHSNHFASANVKGDVLAGEISVASTVLNPKNDISISYSVSVKEGIKDYLDIVPETAFTSETNPPISIPVSVEIMRGEETVLSYKDVLTTLKAAEFDGDINIPANLLKEGTYSIVLRGSVLDSTFELDRKDIVLRTGTTGGGGIIPPMVPQEPETEPETEPEDEEPQKITIDDAKAILEEGKGLEIEFDSGLVLVIPHEAFAHILSVEDMDNIEKININANIIPSSEKDTLIETVKSQMKAGIKLVGDIYEFDVIIETKDGREVEITSELEDFLTVEFEYQKGLKDELVGVYYYDEELKEWKYIGGKIDSENNRITVELTKLGKYAVLEVDRVFDDVSENFWAATPIKVLAARGIVKGVSDSSFAPYKTVTRAEFVAMLVRALNLDKAEYNEEFDDVSRSDWFSSEVATAARLGIVRGTGQKRFNPNDSITRQEMAIMAVNAYRILVGEGGYTAVDLSQFTDVHEISPWAKEYVSEAVALSIIRGTPEKTINPKGTATRAEAAQIIYNLINRLNNR
ncbi:MAG TPA: hypothetical protein GXX36_12410 [Clostridiaceae bacterium]|nr:hypothetical protein [Clostridiaceae bacterium]